MRTNMEINHVNKLNNLKRNNKMQNEQLSFEGSAYKSIDKLKERAEREVPEYGDFAMVSEQFTNTDNKVFAKDVTLRIRPLPLELKNKTPDYKTARWLEAVVTGPYGGEAATVLSRGTKEELLHILSSHEFPPRLTTKLKDLSKDLRAM